MPGAGSLTLFHVRGIRIAVDWSWFLVLFLIIVWLSAWYRDLLGEPDSAIGPYALAVASALAFFGSILLHELGHALVAVRRGIGIASIHLWIFGGVARMQRDAGPGPGRHLGSAGAGGLACLNQRLGAGLQPPSRLPHGRRPHRAGDRLA